MGAALSLHETTRPAFARLMSPASVSTLRCFMMAGSVMRNGCASSLIDRLSSLSRRASSARRVGSARAANVRSSEAS